MPHSKAVPLKSFPKFSIFPIDGRRKIRYNLNGNCCHALENFVYQAKIQLKRLCKDWEKPVVLLRLKGENAMISVDTLKKDIACIAQEYGMTRVTLFGSRADGNAREDSDVDLLVEFSRPVSLLHIARIKDRLEELWRLSVDIVHGPLRAGDMIVIGKEIELYAA